MVVNQLRPLDGRTDNFARLVSKTDDDTKVRHMTEDNIVEYATEISLQLRIVEVRQTPSLPTIIA
jgi:hypothetical protein